MRDFCTPKIQNTITLFECTRCEMLFFCQPNLERFLYLYKYFDPIYHKSFHQTEIVDFFHTRKKNHPNNGK